MELLSAILGTDLGKWLAGIAAACIAALGLYATGKRHERAKAENADLKSANEILKGAADARDHAGSRDADPERLRDDDGFRRHKP